MNKDQIEETVTFLKNKFSQNPLYGIVLGTGLNKLVENVSNPVAIPYDTIPHFPVSTVSFHKGQLIFGQINNLPVVIMQGRFHYYEGYSMQQITFPIRVMAALGIQYLLLSNAAGGINPAFKKGDLVITDDHLNFLPDNPLRGLSNEFGNKFVDMSQPYDYNLLEELCAAFTKENIAIKKGTYAAVMGPNLETKAEYRWLSNSGADMVGMSTVPEVIVANQLGIRCAAVSVITDECDPDNLKAVNIEEIIQIAGKADVILSKIFSTLLHPAQ
ncbi:MAG: purine-nucleoside phosphorylase [Ferruginibacter sp.]